MNKWAENLLLIVEKNVLESKPYEDCPLTDREMGPNTSAFPIEHWCPAFPFTEIKGRVIAK